MYVRLSISNSGDQPFTILPASSNFFDDLGHRVVGAALFSGQTRLTSGTVGPGGRDDLQLGFALPADSSFGALNDLAVQFAYLYGNQSYAAEAQLTKAANNLYSAPATQYPATSPTVYSDVGYASGGDYGYGYGYVSPFYVDTYPAYWGGYPWWGWSSFGFGPWWDGDLDHFCDHDHHHHFGHDGAFVHNHANNNFNHVNNLRSGNLTNGHVVPADRLAAGTHGLLTNNMNGINHLNNVNGLNTRNFSTTPHIANSATMNANPRVFNAPSGLHPLTTTTPHVATTTPRATTITPHAITTTPRTFSSAPARTFSSAPARTFSSAPARTFSSAPARSFSSAPARSFSGGGGAAFHSSGGGFSGGGGHFGGGGGGGGGHGGGGHR